jgi:hypothetical protein
MQLRQLLQQRLHLLQIERVEALGELAIDWSEKIAGLIPLALTASDHTHRRAQFPRTSPFARATAIARSKYTSA